MSAPADIYAEGYLPWLLLCNEGMPLRDTGKGALGGLALCHSGTLGCSASPHACTFRVVTHKASTAGYLSAACQPSTGFPGIAAAYDALSDRTPALCEGRAGMVMHARLCAGHCGAGGQHSAGRSGAAAACDALAAHGWDPAWQPLTASLHSHTRNQRSLQGELVQQPGAVVQAQQPGSSHWAGSALLLASNALQLPQHTHRPVGKHGKLQFLACKGMASAASMVVHLLKK